MNTACAHDAASGPELLDVFQVHATAETSALANLVERSA